MSAAPHQILLLQGPPGGFFRDLAQALLLRGHGVHRVNFNGGDLLSGGPGRSTSFRGHSRDWPSFLARLIKDGGVTHMVMFGDCRPMHRAARATATGLGVIVHVFEEGYLRPDWITLEQGGVNGFSPLISDPEWYRRAAARLGPIGRHARLPASFPTRAKATLVYYARSFALAWAFPFYRTHRPWHPLSEAAGWLGRFAGQSAARRRSQAQISPLAECPYFFLPLQLDSDAQLRAHSDFESMGPALALVMASFVRHAPPGVRLVVKQHPLDNGLGHWRRRTLDYARALGVEDRVVFIEIGDIEQLVGGARGVVTVNSTTGTLALAAGVPVITLGRAIYDIPGLAHQGDLDGFWATPEAPDMALYESFQRVIVDKCLLWGGFHDRASRGQLISAAADRISATPGVNNAQRQKITPSAVRLASSRPAQVRPNAIPQPAARAVF